MTSYYFSHVTINIAFDRLHPRCYVTIKMNIDSYERRIMLLNQQITGATQGLAGLIRSEGHVRNIGRHAATPDRSRRALLRAGRAEERWNNAVMAVLGLTGTAGIVLAFLL